MRSTRLRFIPETESEFQTYFIQRSLPRARWATAIYLALVAVVTAINMRGTMIPFAQSILEPVYLLRLGIACPALVVILAATVIPELHRHYQWIASTAVIVTGISVMLISGFAAAQGLPQFQMGDVLVVVYATLFLGLLFRVVLVVATSLMTAFIAIGMYLGDRRGPDLRGIGRRRDDAHGGAVGPPRWSASARQLHRDPTAQRHCRA